jgi:hypothetical protein
MLSEINSLPDGYIMLGNMLEIALTRRQDDLKRK